MLSRTHLRLGSAALGLCLAGAWLGGCSSSTLNAVDRIASVRSCEPIEVTLEKAQGEDWIESGCGDAARFACVGDNCTSSGGESAPTISTRVSEAAAALAELAPQMDDCFGGASVRVQIFFDARGVYNGARVSPAGADVDCVRTAASSLSAAEGEGALVVSHQFGAALPIEPSEAPGEPIPDAMSSSATEPESGPGDIDAAMIDTSDDGASSAEGPADGSSNETAPVSDDPPPVE